MSGPVRTLAARLAAWSAPVASPERRDWIRAMTRELDDIDSDAAALSWAAGCLATALGTRITPVKILDIIPRALVSLLIAHSGAQQTLKPMMLAHGPEEGPPYDRFNPWIEATPAWQVGMGFFCAALYLASAVQLFRRRGSAVVLFATAFVLDVSDQALMYAEPTFQVLFPEPDVAKALWNTLYMAALGLAAAWLTFGRREARGLAAAA